MGIFTRSRSLIGGACLTFAVLAMAAPAGANPSRGAPDPAPAPSDLPALTGVSLVAQDSAASLIWDPLSIDQGVVIAVAEVPGSTDWSDGDVAVCVEDASVGHCSLDGMRNNTTYKVTVELLAGEQFGDPVDLGEVTPLANPDAVVPSAPSDVQAWSIPTWALDLAFPVDVASSAWTPSPFNAIDGPALMVSWSAPEDNGGAPVQSYEATAYDVATGVAAGSCTVGFYGNTCAVGGLEDGATYQVEVSAVNSAGSSPVGTSDPVVVNASPAKPTLGDPVVTDQGDGSYLVTWSVEDAAAFPNLPFTVTTDQGDWCVALYTMGSNQASCELYGSEAPTGLKVEVGGNLLPVDGGRFWPVADAGQPAGAGQAADAATSPSAPAEPEAPAVVPATGDAPGPEADAPAVLRSIPMASRQAFAAKPARVPAGGGSAVLVLSFGFLLLGVAGPLACRRRR